LDRNDKDGPNAIHGFARARLWEEGPRSESSASFRLRIGRDDHPGYPFDLEAVVGYELLPTGLACAFVVRNVGEGDAPVGVGFHPYVLGAADAMSLRVPASRLVEFDGLLPTGRVIDVPQELDFRTSRPVGAIRLNHCLTGLARDAHGFARVQAGDVEIWMDRAFSHVVLYTGDALGPKARRAVAVEPMTCATDAFNHPEWGLRVLKPGEASAGTWGISPSVGLPG
jgi:aldose 1-epimerase